MLINYLFFLNIIHLSSIFAPLDDKPKLDEDEQTMNIGKSFPAKLDVVLWHQNECTICETGTSSTIDAILVEHGNGSLQSLRIMKEGFNKVIYVSTATFSTSPINYSEVSKVVGSAVSVFKNELDHSTLIFNTYRIVHLPVNDYNKESLLMVRNDLDMYLLNQQIYQSSPKTNDNSLLYKALAYTQQNLLEPLKNQKINIIFENSDIPKCEITTSILQNINDLICCGCHVRSKDYYITKIENNSYSKEQFMTQIPYEFINNQETTVTLNRSLYARERSVIDQFNDCKVFSTNAPKGITNMTLLEYLEKILKLHINILKEQNIKKLNLTQCTKKRKISILFEFDIQSDIITNIIGFDTDLTLDILAFVPDSPVMFSLTVDIHIITPESSIQYHTTQRGLCSLYLEMVLNSVSDDGLGLTSSHINSQNGLPYAFIYNKITKRKMYPFDLVFSPKNWYFENPFYMYKTLHSLSIHQDAEIHFCLLRKTRISYYSIINIRYIPDCYSINEIKLYLKYLKNGFVSCDHVTDCDIDLDCSISVLITKRKFEPKFGFLNLNFKDLSNFDWKSHKTHLATLPIKPSLALSSHYIVRKQLVTNISIDRTGNLWLSGSYFSYMPYLRFIRILQLLFVSQRYIQNSSGPYALELILGYNNVLYFSFFIFNSRGQFLLRVPVEFSNKLLPRIIRTKRGRVIRSMDVETCFHFAEDHLVCSHRWWPTSMRIVNYINELKFNIEGAGSFFMLNSSSLYAFINDRKLYVDILHSYGAKIVYTDSGIEVRSTLEVHTFNQMVISDIFKTSKLRIHFCRMVKLRVPINQGFYVSRVPVCLTMNNIINAINLELKRLFKTSNQFVNIKSSDRNYFLYSYIEKYNLFCDKDRFVELVLDS